MPDQTNTPEIELPEPAFKLIWRQHWGNYAVSKPNIGDTDCYTAEQVRAAILADRSRLQVDPQNSPNLSIKDSCLSEVSGKVDQDARDAKRYRWLRSQHEGDEADSYCVFHDRDGGLDPVGSLPGELDEAIDAAIDAKEPRA